MTYDSKPRIITPNGGEKIAAGGTYAIIWSTGSEDKVKISYSANAGVDWTVVAGNVENTGSYDWSVPDSLSSQYKLKLNLETIEAAFDLSDSLFSVVKGTLSVTSPAGGEIWTGGRYQNIEWVSAGEVSPTVNIEYSVNNGASWSLIAAAAANNGIYRWEFPENPGDSTLVKVTSTVDSSVSGQSASMFTLKPTHSITVTSPNGGESLLSPASTNIRWDTEYFRVYVKIEYSLNSGDSWTVLYETAESPWGRVSWKLPDSVVSRNCLVRVSDTTAGGPSDQSDSAFTISYTPLISLLYPNNGEILYEGADEIIMWSTLGAVDSVKIEYSENDGVDWKPVVSSTAKDGAFPWTIPPVFCEQCKIKIQDASDGLPFVISGNSFAIRKNPGLSLTFPVGGEAWEVSTQQAITWTSDGRVLNVGIEYSVDDSNWTLIVPSIPASDQTYVWTIPNNISETARVRLTEFGGTITSTSPNYFEIMNSATDIFSRLDAKTLKTGFAVYRLGPDVEIAQIYNMDGVVIRRLTAINGVFEWNGHTSEGKPNTKGIYFGKAGKEVIKIFR